ncbi:putative cytokinetic ring protein SteA [Aneurinibacillus aneurinilyticus]|uniref:putative cytokinetic ring protein SteA n=1 Tax=Aneurinibacillus aneurinilyticus TaxID=1391 RepID=UPI0035249EA2
MFIRLGRNNTVCGPVRYGRITKHMTASLRPGDIAIIEHTDIDELAARELIERKVKAIVNCAVSFTGEYEVQGARLLLDMGIPLYDCPAQSGLPGEVSNGEKVVIDGHYLFRERDKMMLTRLLPVTHEEWKVTYQKAKKNTSERLARFIDNTLHYALREKENLFRPLPGLSLHTMISGRHAVVVSRGRHYEEDLQAIRNYITVYRPVLIGVDGGGDALLAQGWRPDIIMGDMDSVSDQALYETKDVIVHAYADGHAPGEERIQSLGIPYHLLRAPGTSEDMALLYAYDNKASLIVGIGTHTSMEDFLEKNRHGMASTLLVRMKVGSKLVDARGIHHLHSPFIFTGLPLFRQLKTLMQTKR